MSVSLFFKPKRMPSDLELKELLYKHHGVVRSVASAWGCSPDTIYDLMKKYDLGEWLSYCRDHMAVQFTEGAMFKKIEEGDTRMIIYYLNKRGKEYGYGETPATPDDAEDKKTIVIKRILPEGVGE